MKIFGDIAKTEKQDDGTIIVMGWASSEAVDSDGEVIKADAIKAAIPDYMKFANIREMHQPKAAGTALEMEVQSDGRTFLKAHIVAADAVKMVENKVYKGFSIGGKVLERDSDDKKIIKGIRLSEISLVDRPANPEAVFTFCKLESEDKEGATGEETKPENNGEASTNADTGKPATEENGENKPAEAEKEAAAGSSDDVKKGMYEVSYLARILSDIKYLQQSSEYEAQSEGDGSAMPAALKSWLATGATLLVSMVTEEAAELTGENNAVYVDVIELADRAKTLVKAAWGEADADKFIKGFDALLKHRGEIIEKAGARNSKADQEKLDTIHKAATDIVAHAKALGACAEKAAGASDDVQKRLTSLAKIEEENATLKKSNEELTSMVESFSKRVKELEALPKAPKGVLRIVEKSKDTPKAENTGEEEPKTAQDSLKKVWANGGQRINL